MTRDLLMPKLGLTMSEGTLLEWKVGPGETVRKGQVVFVVETEKVATEVEADAEGILGEQVVPEGETVPVGAVVGRLSGDGAADGGNPSPSTPEAGTPKEAAPSAAAEPAPAASEPPASHPKDAGARIIATPLARRIARERGVDLRSLTGSGPRGRIKAIDVENAAASPEANTAPAATAGGNEGTRIKPTAVQASMARRLAQIKHGVPHFYLSTEVEVTRLLDMRRQLNTDESLPRLSINHLVMAAVGRSLVDQPDINRIWLDGELLAYSGSDVGMAVETDNGLFVPILRDAGSATLDAIAGSACDLIDRAKSGGLTSAEMTGAAISVSNAGMHDVTWLTSIINPGQSSILGIGSIRQVFRPEENGAPALRNEMGIVFSGDHRVHTGVEGLSFLNRVKRYLEDPMRLLRHR